jgi:hypothetical protein
MALSFEFYLSANIVVDEETNCPGSIACRWFLVLTIDPTLTWKHHIGELTSRMNKACYVIRSIKPFMFLDVLRSTCFSYAHSIISYGITFWGNSSYSEDIFKIQKRILRRIMNSSRNASCRPLFKDLNYLPIQSQYIYIYIFETFICYQK